jgi:hypothetical protein
VWEQYAHLWDSPPERMALTLEHLHERWGGVSSFLRQHGFSLSEQAQLRDRLVD